MRGVRLPVVCTRDSACRSSRRCTAARRWSAGNNSSQVEVVGDAGLLANASDARDIAAKLARVLEDPSSPGSSASRAVAQAAQFSLVGRRPQSARRRWRAAGAGRRRRAPDRGRARRGRGSPSSPPSRPKSGISDYSAALLEDLKTDLRDRPLPRFGLRARAGLADGRLRVLRLPPVPRTGGGA